MQIKEQIKKTKLGKIKKRLNRIGYSRKNFFTYRTRYEAYSATNVSENDERYLRLRILVNTHSIEKGLSHNKLRGGFGQEVVKELFDMTLRYAVKEGHDVFVLNKACAVLNEYHIQNQRVGFDDSEYLPIDLLPIKMCNEKAGAKDYNIKEILQLVNASNFSDFSKCRQSVRIFDKPALDIENELLLKCIELAQNAPNACNRQAVRIHVLKNKNCYDEIQKLQLGCNGFGINASAFIFITNDLTLYECAEVKLPIFDAGMFTMNLVYALLEKGIFSCVLNASFPGNSETRVREIVNIPPNEMINGLLVVYKIDETFNVKTPISGRHEVGDICTFVE